MLKALRHDGIGLSLYAKRLERGRFIWPATEGGASALTAGRMSWSMCRQLRLQLCNARFAGSIHRILESEPSWLGLSEQFRAFC
ncbi:hypothetical protein GOC47_19010 [Sinorhizobium meliloti]|nr:hypothetical protein [Sinorhizobium meliloti]